MNAPKLTCDPSHLPQLMMKAVTDAVEVGLEQIVELVSEADDDRPEDLHNIRNIVCDGLTILIVDVSGGIHAFRAKIERL